MSQRSKWSLIGIPDHLGVVHVGGRIGAAGGPSAFRRCFARLRGRDSIHQLMNDCGDVSPISPEIDENHRCAAAFIRNAHRAHGLSVVIGGGHDHGYSHLVGVSEALGMTPPKTRIGCINIDSHLDVRSAKPVATSGSPFRIAIESGVLDAKKFVEFGIQSHCNGNDLWDFVEHQRIKVVPFEDLRHGKAIQQFKTALKKLSASCDAVAISLDLDAAASCFAPGVSAPQSEGFSASDILEMMECAGEDPKVVSLGIFELNPEHDRDDQTARLSATAAFHFLSRALRR